MMPLPDFVVAGFMKTGTTSIDAYLRQHPDLVLPHDRKETHFFEKEKNWSRGHDWYNSLYKKEGIRGEVCPGYAKRHCFSGVAARIKNKSPNAKIIFCVRNPVNRALSHYRHKLASGNEKREPNAALCPTTDSGNHYLRCSEYAYQIRLYVDCFGKENIHVLTSKELRESPKEAINGIFNHIGASTIQVKSIERRHKSGQKRLPTWNWIYSPWKSSTSFGRTVEYVGKGLLPKRLYRKGPRIGNIEIPSLKRETRVAMKDYFREDVNRLSEMTGKDFDHWDI